MNFICTQSFCYFDDDASMLENGSAPRSLIPPEFMTCAFFYGCAFAAGGQKLYCYSAFNSPNLCAGKAPEAQGCGWIAFNIWPLSPPVPGAGALESRNSYHCSLEMTGPQLRLQGWRSQVTGVGVSIFTVWFVNFCPQTIMPC